MEFKKRLSTQFIYVVKKDVDNASAASLFTQARRQGEFDTGYHYILHKDGQIEVDRQPNCVAQYDFENANVSLYILADTNTGKLTDAQRHVLTSIYEKYTDAEVREVTYGN